MVPEGVETQSVRLVVQKVWASGHRTFSRPSPMTTIILRWLLFDGRWTERRKEEWKCVGMRSFERMHCSINMLCKINHHKLIGTMRTWRWLGKKRNKWNQRKEGKNRKFWFYYREKRWFCMCRQVSRQVANLCSYVCFGELGVFLLRDYLSIVFSYQQQLSRTRKVLIFPVFEKEFWMKFLYNNSHRFRFSDSHAHCLLLILSQNVEFGKLSWRGKRVKTGTCL